MIRGYFSTVGTIRRPFLYCEFEFPRNPEVSKAAVELLVDTGPIERSFPQLTLRALVSTRRGSTSGAGAAG